MPACAPARAEPPSPGGVPRAASGSPPEDPPILSLRRRADFERLFATGHRVRRGGITVLRAPSPDGETRVAVIASRKVGSAVRRNRAKRRIRAVLSGAELPEATHLAVIAGPSVPDVDFERLTSWVTAGLAEDQRVG